MAHQISKRLRHVDQMESYSISRGYAGLSMMCGHFHSCFPGEGWDQMAHRYLKRAVRFMERVPKVSVSLLDGLSGLSFAALSLTSHGFAYEQLLIEHNKAICSTTRTLCHDLAERKSGFPVHLWDLVSGITGSGGYLLSGRRDPKTGKTLSAVLQCLVDLTQEKEGLPRWHTPAHLSHTKEWLAAYPSGSLDCGLAHGIPGPVALLALAKLNGVIVGGLEEALERGVQWLMKNRLVDPWGPNWPYAVSLTATPSQGAERNALAPPARAAWCYGSPGIARALWLAGKALNVASYQDAAIEAMEAVYRRPMPARQIDSPTFCHGIAGLLQITLRFAQEAVNPEPFVVAARDLTHQLILQVQGRAVDEPGLLEGAAGVALVLLSASTPVEPAWDRLFLLA